MPPSAPKSVYEAILIFGSRRLHRPGKELGIDNDAKEETVGTGVSLFFIATGAILTFAVDMDSTDGFNVDAAGVILMVIGLIGLLWSLVAWDDWRPLGRRRYDNDVVVRRDYVDAEPVVPRQAVVADDEPVVRRQVVVDDAAGARPSVRRVYR